MGSVHDSHSASSELAIETVRTDLLERGSRFVRFARLSQTESGRACRNVLGDRVDILANAPGNAREQVVDGAASRSHEDGCDVSHDPKQESQEECLLRDGIDAEAIPWPRPPFPATHSSNQVSPPPIAAHTANQTSLNSVRTRIRQGDGRVPETSINRNPDRMLRPGDQPKKTSHIGRDSRTNRMMISLGSRAFSATRFGNVTQGSKSDPNAKPIREIWDKNTKSWIRVPNRSRAGQQAALAGKRTRLGDQLFRPAKSVGEFGREATTHDPSQSRCQSRVRAAVSARSARL